MLFVHESRRDVNEDAFEPIADGVAVLFLVGENGSPLLSDFCSGHECLLVIEGRKISGF